MDPSHQRLVDVVDQLRERAPGYPREAYLFVVGALAHAAEGLPHERRQDPVRRHLSGQEVLTAVVRLARREFGSLAPAVFEEWGVRAGEDVGEIVFQLVGCGQLSARPEDSIEDFRHGPALARALAGDPGAATASPGPG